MHACSDAPKQRLMYPTTRTLMRMNSYKIKILTYCCCLGCMVTLVLWQMKMTANSNPVQRTTKLPQTPAADNYKHGSTCVDHQIKGDIFREFAKIKQVGAKKTSDVTQRGRILILTLISDSAGRLEQYFSLLCSLSYPHNLITVALGEDSSTDKTFDVATEFARMLRDSFENIVIHKLTETVEKSSVFDEHDFHHQKERRRHLAHARNELLFLALDGRHDWVLWIDSDVIYYPPNLVELLLSAEGDVTAPVCLARTPQSDDYIVYDKNTWKDTPESYEYLLNKPSSFLMLEGYLPTKRKYLSDLRQDGYKVAIDGVGGCTLLVHAKCHKQGLIFPPFAFEHHIETEGLAKMATKMGFSIFGLPFVSVFHEA